MKNLLKRIRLEHQRRGLQRNLDLVYRERENNALLERHYVRELERVNNGLLCLDIGARR